MTNFQVLWQELIRAQLSGQQGMLQLSLAEIFGVRKNCISIDSDDLLGSDCRRIFAFGAATKLTVKCFAQMQNEYSPLDVAHFNYGAVKNRSREAAVMVHEIVKKRAGMGAHSFCSSYYDVKNGFNVLYRQHIAKLCTHPLVGKVLKDHVCDYAGIVPAKNGCSVLRPDRGVAQGSTTATSFFNSAYNSGLRRLHGNLSTLCPKLLGHLPPLKADGELDSVDHPEEKYMGLTSFVDDVSTTIVQSKAEHIKGLQTMVDVKMQTHLFMQGGHLNRDKQVLAPNCKGKHGVPETKKIADTHNVQKSARYLGPMLTWGCTYSEEIQKRVAETHMAFACYAKVWHRRFDRGLKCLLFRGICLNTMLSGLTACVVCLADIKQTNGVLHKLARRAVGGAATKKALVGTEMKFTAVPNRALHQMLKFGFVETELRIARLKFYQGVVVHPQDNELWLIAMFGVLRVDDHASAHRYHRRFSQLVRDLYSLQKHENAFWLTDDICEHPQWLAMGHLDAWVCIAFASMDVSFLRHRETSIATPMTMPSEGIHEDDQEYEHRPTFGVHECKLHFWDGTKCSACFHNISGLRQHILSSKQHSVGVVLTGSSLVVVPQCPWCSLKLGSLDVARNHVRNSFRSFGCPCEQKSAKQVRFPQKFDDAKDIQCALCGLDFGSVEKYRTHVRTHGTPQSGLHVFPPKVVGKFLVSVAREFKIHIDILDVDHIIEHVDLSFLESCFTFTGWERPQEEACGEERCGGSVENADQECMHLREANSQVDGHHNSHLDVRQEQSTDDQRTDHRGFLQGNQSCTSQEGENRVSSQSSSSHGGCNPRVASNALLRMEGGHEAPEHSCSAGSEHGHRDKSRKSSLCGLYGESHCDSTALRSGMHGDCQGTRLQKQMQATANKYTWNTISSALQGLGLQCDDQCWWQTANGECSKGWLSSCITTMARSIQVTPEQLLATIPDAGIRQVCRHLIGVDFDVSQCGPLSKPSSYRRALLSEFDDPFCAAQAIS